MQLYEPVLLFLGDASEKAFERHVKSAPLCASILLPNAVIAAQWTLGVEISETVHGRRGKYKLWQYLLGLLKAFTHKFVVRLLN